MTEIVFIVEESQDGGYFAKALGESIITQADTLSELREMIKDAVKCHFDNPDDLPKIAHLHVTRDEILAL
jgi:predicted RNase H-like HicB family nuclease